MTRRAWAALVAALWMSVPAGRVRAAEEGGAPAPIPAPVSMTPVSSVLAKPELLAAFLVAYDAQRAAAKDPAMVAFDIRDKPWAIGLGIDPGDDGIASVTFLSFPPDAIAAFGGIVTYKIDLKTLVLSVESQR